ncbi:MAG: hypothetical protein ACRC4N_10840, partial [Gammaproteobacteria bacterium]
LSTYCEISKSKMADRITQRQFWLNNIRPFFFSSVREHTRATGNLQNKYGPAGHAASYNKAHARF